MERHSNSDTRFHCNFFNQYKTGISFFRWMNNFGGREVHIKVQQ